MSEIRPMSALAMYERMRAILLESGTRPLVSPPAERVDVDLVVTFVRHTDPVDLGRWEGEGGAPAVEACGAREPALGCGPACTEPAHHRDPHVARDPLSRRFLALWPVRAIAPATGCAS